MATVAEQLKHAREARNLSVQQVAEITKIRTDHIRALEEGDFGAFSAPVYIRGFIRTYSTLLKLDVPAVMAALDKELKDSGNLNPPHPQGQEAGGVLDSLMLLLSKIDWRRGGVLLVTALVLSIVVLSCAVWGRRKKADPLSNLKPAVYQPAQTLPGTTLPLPGTNSSPGRR